jgi:uncharacterized protein (TIGR02265 family)
MAAHPFQSDRRVRVIEFPPGGRGTQVISARDLPQRLDLATPSDSAKGLFHNGALAAVRRTLGEGAVERCRAASGERKFIDFFSYPISTFLHLSFTAAELLRSKLGGYDAAFRTLGKQAVDDFLSTEVGKTLLALAGKDPRRLLSSLPSAYKTAVNYGERHTQFGGERRCVFVMRRDFMPHPYHEGALRGALAALGITTVRVLGRRVGVLDADYEISWD